MASFFLGIWSFLVSMIKFMLQPFQSVLRLGTSNTNVLQRKDGSFVKPYSAVPGPTGLPLLGDVVQFNKIGGPEKFFKYAEHLHNEYGSMVRSEDFQRKLNLGIFDMLDVILMARAKLATQKLLFLNCPKLIGQLVRQEGTYPCSMDLPVVKIFYDLHHIERGGFFQVDEQWKHSRNLAHQLMVQGFPEIAPTIVSLFLSTTQEILDSWAKNTEELLPNLERDCYKIILSGMMAVCLGQDWKKHFEEAEGGELDDLAESSIKLNVHTSNLYKTSSELAYKMQTEDWKCYEQLTLKFINLGHRSTKNAIAAMRSPDSNPSLETFGLVHRFINDFYASEEDTVIQCTDYAFDIMDPMSVSLMWALYVLGRNPKVQEKVYEEITSALGGHKVLEGPLSWDVIGKMDYLDLVRKEIMRLYPAAPFSTRNVQKDADVILGGYKVSPEVTIVTSASVIHRNKAYYPNPEKFWPERWLPNENGQGLQGVTNRNAFMPYGIGKRLCPGYLVSDLVWKSVVASVVLRFVLEAKEEVEPTLVCLLCPDRNLKLCLTMR